jgi:citrate synthase
VSKEFTAGLEDIVAGTSEICLIDGKEGKLIYRGYDIEDLIASNVTFEEVAYLLWYGELPNQQQLSELKKTIVQYQTLPAEVDQLVRLLAGKATPMDTLRTAVSALKSFDDEGEVMTSEANLRKSIKLTAQIPTIVAMVGRLRNGQEPIAPKAGLGISANFLYMTKGEEADAKDIRNFDIALILHADHEFNASTFSARVTCATLSDVYSAITSAIGTLKGPLHGGANEAVMRMLMEIGELDKVEAWVMEGLAEKKKIMGFGHRVYKTMDPRAVFLRNISKEVGERNGNTKWYEMTEKVFEVVHREKGLNPNVDLFSASAYYMMGIDLDLYTPIFAMSRVTGWTAHVLEQYANNRIIRPTSIYNGPELRKVKPIEQR